MQHSEVQKVEIKGEKYQQILTPDAIAFLAKLHNTFDARRLELLRKRDERQQRINAGEYPDFLPDTETVRKDSSWNVAATPDDLQQRWVEITGPTDRKMMINAMNSGADVFMADFEDANAPTWDNMVQGHINLKDTLDGTITFESPEGKRYSLQEENAVLFVRPRGWHLNEKHFVVKGEEISGSLFDFGLYMFHNAKHFIENGVGPYFYLAKLQSHLEARLWNDVFVFTQKELGIPQGTIRATVLIETILAVFEMEEILYELKEHSAGLNAGRWDYLFSIIKTFRRDQNLKLPNRGQVTMEVPFMRAYTELLVKTCHQRGAHAIGGMAAFIPNKRDPEVTEHALRKVREDKLREVGDGFDGTWVAHPDLVPVAREVFATALGDRLNQRERMREDVDATAEDLLNFTIPGGTITEEGLRHNINVALQYLSSWLCGRGAAAIYNLMEDTATAEISRAQVWQWLHSKAHLEDGTEIDQELLERLIQEEEDKIAEMYGKQFDGAVFAKARTLFETLVFAEHFIEFLTLPAYKEL
ncbi:MAG: Malate synthase A [Chlamydiae bacterium]|nr:Malate synthase A [Chlamydiota bacterium]